MFVFFSYSLTRVYVNKRIAKLLQFILNYVTRASKRVVSSVLSGARIRGKLWTFERQGPKNGRGDVKYREYLFFAFCFLLFFFFFFFFFVFFFFFFLRPRNCMEFLWVYFRKQMPQVISSDMLSRCYHIIEIFRFFSWI